MFSKVFIIVSFVAVALAAEYGYHEVQQHGYGHEEKKHKEEHHYVDYHDEPHYSFHYEVKDEHTKDIKSHKESRKGDHTEGEYSLVEPDGTTRIVKYQVEGKHSGWLAHVERKGHAKHEYTKHEEHKAPAHQEHYKYHAAPVHYEAPVHHVYHSAPLYHVEAAHHAEISYHKPQHSYKVVTYHKPQEHKEESYHKPQEHKEVSYHKPQPKYHGSGHSSSSSSFSVHGAQVTLKTNHNVPAKHGSYY